MRRKPIQSETACFCWINRLIFLFYFIFLAPAPRRYGTSQEQREDFYPKKRLHAFSLNLYPLPSEPIYEANECMFVTDRILTSWCSKSLLFLCSRTRRKKKCHHFFFLSKGILAPPILLPERCNNESTISTLSVSFTSFQCDYFNMTIIKYHYYYFKIPPCVCRSTFRIWE